jgi:hypothetical protein
MPSFTHYSGFAGIGAFAAAFKHVGGQCLGGFEWCSAAASAFEQLNPSVRLEGDFRQLDVAAVPGCDVYDAGAPCQSFSVAGRPTSEPTNPGWALSNLGSATEPNLQVFGAEGQVKTRNAQPGLNFYCNPHLPINCGFNLPFLYITHHFASGIFVKNSLFSCGPFVMRPFLRFRLTALGRLAAFLD